MEGNLTIWRWRGQLGCNPIDGVIVINRRLCARLQMSGLERLERDLACTIRRLYERGLVSGVGGNASVLLPSKREMLITPRDTSRAASPRETWSG